MHFNARQHGGLLSSPGNDQWVLAASGNPAHPVRLQPLALPRPRTPRPCIPTPTTAPSCLTFRDGNGHHRPVLLRFLNSIILALHTNPPLTSCGDGDRRPVRVLLGGPQRGHDLGDGGHERLHLHAAADDAWSRRQPQDVEGV